MLINLFQQYRYLCSQRVIDRKCWAGIWVNWKVMIPVLKEMALVVLNLNGLLKGACPLPQQCGKKYLPDLDQNDRNVGQNIILRGKKIITAWKLPYGQPQGFRGPGGPSLTEHPSSTIGVRRGQRLWPPWARGTAPRNLTFVLGWLQGHLCPTCALDGIAEWILEYTVKRRLYWEESPMPYSCQVDDLKTSDRGLYSKRGWLAT